VAARIAVDRLRSREVTTSEDEVLEQLADWSDGPELAHVRARYTSELKLAFEAALATLDVRERNVLRHHFIDRLALDEVGALYGVHKATASRWLEAARTTLSKRTRAHFQGRVQVMPSELESIMRLVQSHVDLSLSRVLS
jgi:RNA polymerase sigma-70 factor (ECF subfamily)